MSMSDGEKLAMSFKEPRDFTKSLRIIEELQNLLKCNTCKKLMQDPITLWSCDHLFCRECVSHCENCPVCSLPAWKEDQNESKAITSILETSKALKSLLQGYMDFADRAGKCDSAVTFPGSSQRIGVSEERNGAISFEQDVPLLEPLPEQIKKPKKTYGRKSKFKITPAKPFPEISDDSDETPLSELSVSNTADPLTAVALLSSKPKVTARITHKKSTFAAPTPSKRKQLSNQIFQKTTPKIFKSSGPVAGTPKTPKNVSRKFLTPMKSPGMMKNPKTPKSVKKNKKGETPLHVAAIKGDTEEVGKLFQLGVDINATDNAGWTPLHEACNHGHVEVVEQLLCAGALTNVPGYEDETPLMDAARQGHTDVVKLLLEHGADVYLRKSNGLTASDLTDSDEIKQIFEDHIVLTQKALDDCSLENVTGTPTEPIILTYHFTLNVGKINQVTEILKAVLRPKDALTATHYITPSYEDGKSPIQIKYLQAVARGIWVVKTDWLEACKAAGSWVSEHDFEIAGSRTDLMDGGPSRSRMNKAAKRPPIFHGYHFYLSGSFKPPSLSKQLLNELIQSAGGSLLTREPKPDSDSVQTCTKVPYHAHKDTPQYYHTHYIVYDSENVTKPVRNVRRGKVCTVPLSWLLDCISQFYLCEIPEIF